MELRDKIAEVIADMTDCHLSGAEAAASAILAIPEIAEALWLKAHRDTKVGYERQG